MPAPPGPELVAPVLDALARLRHHAARTEDEVLDGLAVLGEPAGQRVLDGWLDQVADTLRAVAEECSAQAGALRRLADPAVRPGPAGATASGRAGRGSTT